jgi:hypothetical protein
MSVRRWIRIWASQASVPDSKPRFIPVQLRQADIVSPHASSAEITQNRWPEVLAKSSL